MAAPRLQSGIAVSSNGQDWILINTSPDLPVQIERFLSPAIPELRSSPIREIFLTNADLDHVLGLMLLRENTSALRINAPVEAKDILCKQFPIGPILDAYCGVEWNVVTEDSQVQSAGLEITPVILGRTGGPRYAQAKETASVGYVFTDPANGRKAGFFPDVAEFHETLPPILKNCDAVFFDGTFWHENEMKDLGFSSRSASEIGHIPMAGPTGSLQRLSDLRLPFCAYLHINNTNPVLLSDSAERREVEVAGLSVAEDGMHIEL